MPRRLTSTRGRLPKPSSLDCARSLSAARASTTRADQYHRHSESHPWPSTRRRLADHQTHRPTLRGDETHEAVRVSSAVITVYFSASSGTGQSEATKLARKVTGEIAGARLSQAGQGMCQALLTAGPPARPRPAPSPLTDWNGAAVRAAVRPARWFPIVQNGRYGHARSAHGRASRHARCGRRREADVPRSST